MRFTLSCPASAPKGCFVQLSAKIAGQKAIGTTTGNAVERQVDARHGDALQDTTRRLKKKGGALTVTAKTALSTLDASTQSVKVKRRKAKRRAATR